MNCRAAVWFSRPYWGGWLSCLVLRACRRWCSWPFVDTWLKDVSFKVWGPRSIIAWSGSSTSNIPFTFLSPKYRRDASSKPSCHISCHRMATRISSSLTCFRTGKKIKLLKENTMTLYWLNTKLPSFLTIMNHLRLAARGHHKSSHNAVRLFSASSWSDFSQVKLMPLKSAIYLCSLAWKHYFPFMHKSIYQMN